MSTRREFVRTVAIGSVTLPLLDFFAHKASAASSPTTMTPHLITASFPGYQDLTTAGKMAQIEHVTAAARTHPSGIFICMPKISADGMRQVRISDFEGMDQFSENFGLKFKSITDFFDNENSITVSGSHLAAQSLRYAASGDPDALAAARQAYASLRIIFQFGVEAGRAGFMGKPYHFEYSDHTTGDQYLHMLWGLWSFYPVASLAEQVEIREMITTVADYQMATDYTVHYQDGRSWNMREDATDYNAIMAALVAAAYKLSGDQKYHDACAYVIRTGQWMTHRRLDYIIAQIRTNTWEVPPWEAFVGDQKRAAEFVHWEQIQHCQFIAIAASIIHESAPDLLSADELSDVVGLWWDDYTVGFDSDYWGYLYWFFVSANDRSWRPVKRTERVPREQWFGGHPMLSYASEWIYGDCLGRFLWTAMVVARHCPPKKEAAVAFAAETLNRLQPQHLLWINDPDGKQIPPELGYFTEFLSSEVPECVIASYWEGRRLGFWS